jgi:hypothetical protein
MGNKIELPNTYEDYLSELQKAKKSGDMERYDALIAAYGSKLVKNYTYDGYHGKIADTNKEVYEKIMKNEDGGVCAQSHQSIAASINDSGGEARSFKTDVFTNEGTLSHISTVATEKSGLYSHYDWNSSKKIVAPDMIRAVEKIKAENPWYADNGFTTIYSKDGEHSAIKKSSISGMTVKDYDIHSATTLREPLELVKTDSSSVLKVKAEPSYKMGTDPNFGDFSTNALRIQSTHNVPLGKGFEARAGLDSSYESISASRDFGKFKREYDFNVFSAKANMAVLSPKLELSESMGLSTRGFAFGNWGEYSISSNYSLKKADEITKGKSTNTEIYRNLGVGAIVEAGNDKSKVDLTLYGGGRMVNDVNSYNAGAGTRGELVYGGSLGFRHTGSIGDVKVTAENELSLMKVDGLSKTTNIYDKTQVSAQLGKNKITGFGGLNNTSIQIEDLKDKYKSGVPFVGIGYERQQNKNITFGANVVKTPSAYAASFSITGSL